MFYVYILQSLKDNRYYIGYTNDLNRRIEEHNRGKSKSIKHRGSFELIYKEAYSSKMAAIKREKQIKKYKGGEAFKALISKSCKNFSSDPIV